MNRKKIISMIIASTMLLGISMNVMAESDTFVMPKQRTVINIPPKYDDKEIKFIEKEEVVKVAKSELKKYFDVEITEDYNVQSNFNNFDGMREPYWQVRFYNNKEKIREDIYISISAISEKIISYSNYSNGDETQNIAEYSYTQARAIALEKIKEVFPKQYKEIRITDNTISTSGYNGEYYFNFKRENQGILFEENGISVRVDGTTGDIKNLNIDWEYDITFPDKNEAMSLSKAENGIIDGTEFTLKYREFRNKYRYQDEDNKKNIKLVYDMNFNNGYSIDAITGEFIYKNENEIETAELDENEKNKVMKHYKEIKKLSEDLKEKEAIKLGVEVAEKYYGKGFEVESSYYSENELKVEKTWSLRLTKSEKIEEEEIDKDSDEKKTVVKDIITNVYVVLDAETGKIKNMNRYDRVEVDGRGYYFNDEEEFEPSLSWKEGYTKAVEFIQNNYEDKLKNIEYKVERTIYTNRKGIPTNERSYQYTFSRVENGIEFERNSISVTIDAEDGTISNIYSNWYDDAEFVSPNKKMSEEAIQEIAIEKYEPELRYIRNKEGVKLAYVYEGTKQVYNFNDFDGFTGELLSYSGEEIIENVEEFMKEIKDSKNRKELEILAYSGLIDIREFELDKEITNKDLIKAIVDAFGYRTFEVAEAYEADGLVNREAKTMVADDNKTPENGYDLTDEDYIEMAEFYGIISGKVDKGVLSQKVSRVDMARAMIKFTGYEDIATIKGIFKVEAEDANKIDDKDIGFAALAVGFDILVIDNNEKLNPEEEIKAEELFRGLFYALKNKKADYNRYPIMYRAEK